MIRHELPLGGIWEKNILNYSPRLPLCFYDFARGAKSIDLIFKRSTASFNPVPSVGEIEIYRTYMDERSTNVVALTIRFVSMFKKKAPLIQAIIHPLL
jgi:hypothetical protein